MKPVHYALVVFMLTICLAGLLFMLAPTDARATGAFQRGDYDAASVLYLDSAVRHPESVERLYSAGSVQVGRDDYEAAALLELAAAEGDMRMKARAAYNAGAAYFGQGDYFSAARAFRDVLVLYPDNDDARYNYELSLWLAVPPTPSEQQQQTRPEDGFTDPTVTPSPEPGGFDGPTPTPPREEFEPDPTQPPQGGTGDFGDDADSTPVPVIGGKYTIEEARRILDAAAQDALLISPFDETTQAGDGPVGGNDW